MRSARAFAKINLALVVGAPRDGKHDVATVLQLIDLHDTIAIEAAETLVVEGFAEDTIVRDAVEALARAAGCEPRWRVGIEKRIPVAAGLGGGSSDAATALTLANESLDEPLAPDDLHLVAARVGADVPFFLVGGAQLGTDDGTVLERLELPTDYSVVLVVPTGVTKTSTGDVYRAFDARGGADGFARSRSRTGGRARLGHDAVRPHETSAQRPRLVATRVGARGCRGVPCGRHRRRSRGVRAVRGARDRDSGRRGPLGCRRVVRRASDRGGRPIVSGKMAGLLGRGQVVRQRVLVP